PSRSTSCFEVISRFTRNKQATFSSKRLVQQVRSSAGGASHPDTMVHVMPQHGIERRAGANRLIVDDVAGTTAAQVIEEFRHGFPIAFSQGLRIADQRTGFFESFKLCRAGEVEVEFLVIEDVKQHD